MPLHFQPKIHPYWLVVQVSINFPWDPERYHSHCLSAVDPVSVPQSQTHQSFLPLMFNSCPPTLVQYLGILFPVPLFRHIFFIFRLPFQTWFQSYTSYFFSWLLTCSSAIRIPFFPESSVASSTLQLMEKGQMEDVSMRISLIFLHIGVKEKL